MLRGLARPPSAFASAQQPLRRRGKRLWRVCHGLLVKPCRRRYPRLGDCVIRVELLLSAGRFEPISAPPSCAARWFCRELFRFIRKVACSSSACEGSTMAGKEEMIFEPFQSTKKRGTGLGLYISFQIVKRHGGGLWVTNDEGKGASFVARFPYRQPESQ